MKNSRIKGIVFILSGQLLWGVSGTVAQYLFQEQNFTPEWLVVMRMLISGVLLIAGGLIHRNKNISNIWKSKEDVVKLLIFSIFGMLGVQYTYFAAINHGNAATAAILQYLAPIIITVYLCLRNKGFPTLKQLLCVCMAMIGTFLIITKGNMNSLSISKLAVFWGIASAFGGAIYTVQPVSLLKKYDSVSIVGWGMLIGGGALSLIYSPFNCTGSWGINSVLAIIFVVLFGTLIAFCCYLESLKYLEPYEASLFGCIEPLSAAMLSIIFLNVIFEPIQWIGTLFIIITISLLSIIKE